MRKPRRAFTREQRKKAVEEFISGAKSAVEIAADLGTDPTHIYRWKVAAEEAAKGARMDALEAEGHDPLAARKILKLEEELEEYKKKVGELTLINDLLKKIPQRSSQSESELSGLIDTMKSSARKRKPVK
jgi:transposase-like protein